MKYLDWLKAIDDIASKDGLEAANFFIKESLADKQRLHFFGRYFFPHIIKGLDEVPECHKDLIKEINRRKDGAIIFPRGFAKSTWIKIDTIHDIVYKLEPVILYIGNTISDAGFHFESMKAELENNLLLRTVYGNVVPLESDKGKERIRRHYQKWTNKHFETTTKINVVARGAGKGRGVNIKNQRPTKIIIDDAEDDIMVKSKERRQKFHNWLYDVIIPSKDPTRGYIKMIGTVIAPHCEVLKFYKQHGGTFRKGIENGDSIWPAYRPIEQLMELKKQVGSRTFSQEILNTPVNDELSIIKPSWLKFYNTLDRKRKVYVSIMFDPQSGESKDADFYGLGVVGKYRADQYRYVMEMHSGRDSKLNQAALFVRTYQRFKDDPLYEIANAGVEVVLGQVAVYQLVLEWKAGRIELPDVNNEDRNIKVTKIDPERRTKTDRLEDHEADFERGEILFHESLREFAEKLTCFPSVEHDDDIDALSYCLQYSNKSSSAGLLKSTNNANSKTIHGNIYQKQF